MPLTFALYRAVEGAQRRRASAGDPLLTLTPFESLSDLNVGR
jgi:hypothetical protein